MTRGIFSVTIGICALFGASAVNAQYSERHPSYSRPYVAPTPIWNYPRFGYDKYGYHASTLEEGVLSGMGNFYRGAGEYEVANSIAAYNWQLARMASLQNSIAERQARAAVYASVRLGHERRHQENIKKNRAVAAFHARERQAVLTEHQFDRKTGELKWPAALQSAFFDDERAAVEATVSQMIDLQQVSTRNSDREFSESVAALRTKLVKYKEELRPNDYYAAKAFLERLQNESRIDSSQTISF
jgi:hypothetical protein